MSSTPQPQAPRKSDIDRGRYEIELRKRPPNPTEQLTLFEAFIANTPKQYTNLFEFVDTLPLFILTAPTTKSRNGRNQMLEIQKFEKEWGGDRIAIAIKPVVLEAGVDPETGAPARKEVLPGPREYTIYRVLKKMAADERVERISKDKSVVLRFTIHQLRVRLRDVGHEFKSAEIREALEVLNGSRLAIKNVTRDKTLYTGPYISLAYAADDSDPEGERTLVEVGFNELSLAAMRAQLYDRIHYQRLMSLSALSARIYEMLTANFRQASTGYGYKISLGRLLSEGGLIRRKTTRNTVGYIRQALKEMVDRGVIASYPPYTEEVISGPASRKGGRRPIEDVIWTVFAHDDVIRDIKSDNADQARRRERLAPTFVER